MKKRKRKTNSNEKTPFGEKFSELKGNVENLNWKLLLILVLNTIILCGLYYYIVNYLPNYSGAIMIVYALSLSAMIIAYFVYNKGILQKHITEDMFPSEWSFEEKNEYILQIKQRAKKSKWMLTVIFPLIITFAIDIINLFLLDSFKNIFS